MLNGKRRESTTYTVAAISPKRSRRCLTIKDKIMLLDRLNSGERPMNLSREYEISDSTIRSLVNNEKYLRKYAEQCTQNTFQSVAYIPRDEVLAKMENQLYSWYEEERQNGGAKTMAVICAKARDIYAQLQEYKQDAVIKDKSNEHLFDVREFKASKSWFFKFRKRYNLEFGSSSESEVPDLTAANLYPAAFDKLVQAGGFQPHQVFTAVEFSFAWKRMPSCTSIAKTDKTRDRIGSDRISLLICNNAMGNFYIKPMLVNRTRTPFCLRTSNTSDLPVFWRWRERGTQSLPRVTAASFHDWLTLCFTPTARKYLQVMKMPQRCLLLLGSEIQQMVLPTYDDSFLRVEFLPSNTSQLLQPLTKSVLPIFQSKYLRRYFEHFLNNLKDMSATNLYKAWQKYNIADAIDIIHESFNEISEGCWKCGWHRLWPEISSDSQCNSQLIQEITHIVIIGNQLPGEGFADICIDDVKQDLKLDSSLPCDCVQEPEDIENPDSLNNFKEFSGQALDKSLNEMDINENDDDELISLCSAQDLHWDEGSGSVENEKEANNSNENEILIQIGCTEDETVSEIEQSENEEMSEMERSEDEAIFEFHDTENNNFDEETRKSMLRSNTQNQNQCRARAQLQIINKAFNLKQELLDTVRQLETHTNFSDFTNGLETLMQPYVEFKKTLLQPSIKDYFS